MDIGYRRQTRFLEQHRLMQLRFGLWTLVVVSWSTRPTWLLVRTQVVIDINVLRWIQIVSRAPSLDGIWLVWLLLVKVVGQDLLFWLEEAASSYFDGQRLLKVSNWVGTAVLRHLFFQQKLLLVWSLLQLFHFVEMRFHLFAVIDYGFKVRLGPHAHARVTWFVSRAPYRSFELVVFPELVLLRHLLSSLPLRRADWLPVVLLQHLLVGLDLLLLQLYSFHCHFLQ